MSKKSFKYIYDFVLGRIPSHPRMHVAHGPWVGLPELYNNDSLRSFTELLFSKRVKI